MKEWESFWLLAESPVQADTKLCHGLSTYEALQSEQRAGHIIFWSRKSSVEKKPDSWDIEIPDLQNAGTEEEKLKYSEFVFKVRLRHSSTQNIQTFFSLEAPKNVILK